jgi:hypothetical protein
VKEVTQDEDVQSRRLGGCGINIVLLLAVDVKCLPRMKDRNCTHQRGL